MYFIMLVAMLTLIEYYVEMVDLLYELIGTRYQFEPITQLALMNRLSHWIYYELDEDSQHTVEGANLGW
jgi:hypothetical protein